ncbi:4-hydroxy-tetrahydrodipicolinate synthase [Actinokineospora alba]|uniref:4-hydroxy-tetrahydrodipicolinate synthase n=1 Tax=Actinokineospora alba TaxID=504798 RepID=A0A1H0UX73_9PSEU|nr:4-hydroxy-tetrahydrodipicolinate synthase [Actinokineospora alba]TDP68997.1 4-hydroxy-tetrahydrodipicolinate synthase [Actinokineospora alba]SDI77043.1 4-hydroxy-tetrahydrodipicolinate synthase [Actinokineospora alba]SDP70842.1 4-hydroxy-tetrahydrodipicolinate synthase [Actinokineospora alba]
MELAGILVPLITPFTADDQVDRDALACLAHEVITDGATGIVALGTTAEVAALDPDERATVIDIVASVARERHVPLIVGAGGSATAASVRALNELTPDISAALTLVPPFTRPTEQGVIEHFRVLAKASPVPLVIYNVPYRTALTLSAETVLRIAEIPGVIGTKHSVGAIDATTIAIMNHRPDGFAVLAGDDVLAGPLLALGAEGGILASAHVRTAAYADLVDAWAKGDLDRARALGHRLADLSAALFAEPNPAVIKAVLHDQGRIATPAVRLPHLPASQTALESASGRLAFAIP